MRSSRPDDARAITPTTGHDAAPGDINPHDSARQDSARHDGATAHHAGSSDTAPAFSTVPDAPRSDDPALIARLHADLVAAGFTVDGVTDLVGEQAMSAWSRDQAVPARRALQRRSRELGSAPGRAGDLLEIFFAALVQLAAVSIEQHLGEHLNRPQRRAHVMRKA